MLSFSSEGFSVNRIFNSALNFSWNSLICCFSIHSAIINIPFSKNYYVIYTVDNNVMFYMKSKYNFADGET